MFSFTRLKFLRIYSITLNNKPIPISPHSINRYHDKRCYDKREEGRGESILLVYRLRYAPAGNQLELHSGFRQSNQASKNY